MKRPHTIYSENFVCYLENDEMANRHFKALQNAFKKLGIKGAYLRRRTRSSRRQEAYGVYGLHYHSWHGNRNEVKMWMKPYIDYYSVYVAWRKTYLHPPTPFNGRDWYYGLTN